MDNKQKPVEPGLFSSRIVLFIISQNLSLFGSSVVGYAIIWYITIETSSGLWLMYATLANMVPHLIISLWSGVWADRYRKKYLIMISDGFIAFVTLVLFILFRLGYDRLELLLIVSVIRSLGTGVQGPAVSAILPQLVAKEHLTRMQGINQSISSVLFMLSPAVGGMVLGLTNLSWAFLLDVATATIAITIFSFIKVDSIKRAKRTTPVTHAMVEGVRYTFGNPILRTLIIYYSFAFFLLTPAAILTPLLVDRTFGSEVWKLTANELSWTLGNLIGGILVSLRGHFKDKVRAIAISLVVFGVGFALLGLATHFFLYLLIMTIVGIFMPILTTAETVMIQKITEPNKMGRVFSIVQVLSGSTIPLGMLFYGPLADVVSIESLLIVSGILMALVGVLYQRTNRRMREQGVWKV
ncbi:MFS transporter [Sphaerochaeta sp. PS]|uniref:MFS transporter n=1 Tax=Sphaerochaeta sp. PS TaxID=3076336 RepID=UPI0028A4F3F6|nr:MFS transporter [Sphaerochaeta sp. PS]MDT4763160.1 MFS transporter [Sphaerochaeta sp. PS]